MRDLEKEREELKNESVQLNRAVGSQVRIVEFFCISASKLSFSYPFCVDLTKQVFAHCGEYRSLIYVVSEINADDFKCTTPLLL